MGGQTFRALVAAASIGGTACAHAIQPRPPANPSTPATEAVLILPGFGYGGDGARAFRALAPAIAAEGLDLYVPTYVARGGLTDSRARLERFIRDERLNRYARVHVFAFIAGGWTFNPLSDRDVLPNLATIVYDRSPYQERAPRIATEKMPLLAWLKYGSTIFDVAKTPYAPLTSPGVGVGLVVETEPTGFIKRFRETASRQGPYRFECGAFGQQYDDCVYVAVSHTQLYERFAEVWPEVRAFIRSGRFTPSANRTPPGAGQAPPLRPMSPGTPVGAGLAPPQERTRSTETADRSRR